MEFSKPAIIRIPVINNLCMDNEAILSALLNSALTKKKDIHDLWPLIRQAASQDVPLKDIYQLLRGQGKLNCSYAYFTRTVRAMQLGKNVADKSVQPNHLNVFGGIEMEQSDVIASKTVSTGNTTDDYQRVIKEPATGVEKKTSKKIRVDEKTSTQKTLPGTSGGFSLDYDPDDLI